MIASIWLTIMKFLNLLINKKKSRLRRNEIDHLKKLKKNQYFHKILINYVKLSD